VKQNYSDPCGPQRFCNGQGRIAGDADFNHGWQIAIGREGLRSANFVQKLPRLSATGVVAAGLFAVIAITAARRVYRSSMTILRTTLLTRSRRSPNSAID
jgi:hypothetical protein